MLYNLRMAEKWITVKEAADRAGYHVEYVRKLLQAERIDGQKWGTVWQVDRESLLTYVSAMEARGERRGRKKR